MADTLSGLKLIAKLTATLKNDINSGASNPASFSGGITFEPDALTDGITANQADKYWESRDRSLAISGTEDIDVYDFGAIDVGGGAGKDPVGGSLALAEIVALAVINDKTSTGSILVGGKAAATAWNSPFNGDDNAQLGPFGPGAGVLLWDFNATAWAVADTTNHLLTITENGSGAVTYDIFILGRSA